MADLNDKLKQLMAQRGLMLGSQWRQERDRVEQQRQSARARGDFEIDKCVPGEVVENEAGAFYRVRTDFPLDACQGGVPLGDIFSAAGEHIAFSACDQDLAGFDPATAVFVDIETTGLAGGAGTTAFLVGAGYFTAAPPVFRLDQCFMRDFDDEEAMLLYLQDIFARVETVVTFNGKTFDVPLLRSRFISNRLPFRLDAALHYDLIHAVRRIFKLRLKDCSLANVEREVLNIHRHGDIPGAEIPQVWFDYLRSRDARVLPRVFNHHRNDVVSLVALAALIAQRLSVPCGDGFDHAEDRLSVVRLHHRQKKFEAVVEHARKLLECETDNSLRRECLCILCSAYKRMQDWQQMEEILNLMTREFPSDLTARLELAKYHEHRSRNLAEALRICHEALQICPPYDQDFIADFQRRKTRLERKLQKNQRKEDL